jgi:hypothetical protein
MIPFLHCRDQRETATARQRSRGPNLPILLSQGQELSPELRFALNVLSRLRNSNNATTRSRLGLQHYQVTETDFANSAG